MIMIVLSAILVSSIVQKRETCEASKDPELKSDITKMKDFGSKISL